MSMYQVAGEIAHRMGIRFVINGLFVGGALLAIAAYIDPAAFVEVVTPEWAKSGFTHGF